MPPIGRKTKSMRGTVVDFDLLDIKTQMADTPKTTEVQAREDFVDRKLRRRKRIAENAAKAAQQKQSTVEVDAVEPTTEVKEELRHVAETDTHVHAVAAPEVSEDDVETEEPKEVTPAAPKTRTIKKKTTEE